MVRASVSLQLHGRTRRGQERGGKRSGERERKRERERIAVQPTVS